MLKIYGRANSINVRKVLWVAEEIGLAYRREDWGRGFRPLSEPAFTALNPMQAIPVIDDAGFILRESHTITRYLADQAKRADLYPAEPKARWMIDAWMDWAGSDLYWGVRPVFTGLHLKLPQFNDRNIIAAAIGDWGHRMRLLDAHLAAGNPYLAGQSFTIADIPAGLIVNRWFSIDFEKPQLAAVAAYYERLSLRAPFRLHGRNGTP